MTFLESRDKARSIIARAVKILEEIDSEVLTSRERISLNWAIKRLKRI